MPSTYGYMLGAGAAAAALFFLLWWMLHSSGDEAPWVPAGLAASVVMLVAIAAREVVMRRAWTRYILEHDRRDKVRVEAKRRSSSSSSNNSSSNRSSDSSSGVSSSAEGNHRAGRSMETYAAMLRALQKQCAEADAAGTLPEAHLEAYLSCQEYLENATDALRAASSSADARVTLRAGQERVRSLARHHMLSWARVSSRALTHQAQQRVRLSDKIETAKRALEVIESATRLYPEEAELRDSEQAVREFISSAKVSHWVELAERAAFKEQYARAIDRYRDALFYLSREKMAEDVRAETASRIEREIDLLRARVKTSEIKGARHDFSQKPPRGKNTARGKNTE
jgi:hypothetical protein